MTALILAALALTIAARLAYDAHLWKREADRVLLDAEQKQIALDRQSRDLGLFVNKWIVGWRS